MAAQTLRIVQVGVVILKSLLLKVVSFSSNQFLIPSRDIGTSSNLHAIIIKSNVITKHKNSL